MANDKFSIKEALKYGWDAFKARIAFFLCLMIGMVVITIIPALILNKMTEPNSSGWYVMQIILSLYGLVVGMAMLRITLNIFDSNQPRLSELKDLLSLIPSFLFGKLLYFLIVFIGTLLLIIPGVIVYYMFLYIGYLIVDRRLGPIEALHESRAITDGYKKDLFWFGLALILVNAPMMGTYFYALSARFILAGSDMPSQALVYMGLALKYFGILLMFLTPALLVTIPVTLMASVYVYRQLSPAESA